MTMSNERENKRKKKGHRHLTPLEVITIAEAVNRGEKVTRPMYSDCREAWFNWKEGDILPHDAKIIPYQGEIPEVFE